MPRKPETAITEMENIIRKTVALDPLVSLRKIQKILGDNNYPIRKLEYIAKLRDRVHRRAIAELDQTLITERITETTERWKLSFVKLMQIAFGEPRPGEIPPKPFDQIMAITKLMELDLKLLSAQMDAGMFQRHIGLIEHEHRIVPIPAELKEQVNRAMIAWTTPTRISKTTAPAIKEAVALLDKSNTDSNHSEAPVASQTPNKTPQTDDKPAEKPKPAGGTVQLSPAAPPGS